MANDCVLLIAKAIEVGGANRRDLNAGLTSIGTKTPPVMGALGENKFDENGDMVRDMLIYVVKEGVAVLHE